MQSYKELVRDILRLRVVRALFSGAVGVVVQTIVFELISIWLGLVRPSVGVVIGGELGLLTNFFINNHVTFFDVSHAPLWRRLVRFHIVVCSAFVIQWLFVFLAEESGRGVLVIHLAYAASLVVSFVSNYTWYRVWVWRHHQEPEL